MRALNTVCAARDPYASAMLLQQLLRELADNGATVIMVLHGPRAQILNSIDKFLILSDGRDIFFGGLPAMLQFFEQVKVKLGTFCVA